MMPDLESIKQSVLSECEEDHVGLWSVVRDVEAFLPQRDETAIQEQVLKLVHELLLANEIKAGFPTRSGRGFRTLDGSPDEIVARIRAEWPKGRLPTIGEGLWFTKPKED